MAAHVAAMEPSLAQFLRQVQPSPTPPSVGQRGHSVNLTTVLAMLRSAAQGNYTNLQRLFHWYPNMFDDIRDEQGNTLLHLASASSSLNSVAFCLMHSRQHLEFRNNEGRTPLLMAAANGRDQNVEMLLAWGADVLAHDLNQNTALTLAIGQCGPQTRELLERRLSQMM